MDQKIKKIGRITGFVLAESVAIVASISCIRYMTHRHNTPSSPSQAIVVEVDQQYRADDIKSDEEIDVMDLLKDVTPIDVKTTGHTTAYSYRSQDLEPIHYRCNQRHFSFTYEEFEEQVQDIHKDIFFTSNNISEYNNIDVYENDNYRSVHTYFTTTESKSNSSITCSINYDSSTHEIHEIMLYTGHFGEEFEEYADKVIAEMFDGYALQTDYATIRKQYNNTLNPYKEYFGDVQVYVYVMNDYTSVTLSPKME